MSGLASGNPLATAAAAATAEDSPPSATTRMHHYLSLATHVSHPTPLSPVMEPSNGPSPISETATPPRGDSPNLPALHAGNSSLSTAPSDYNPRIRTPISPLSASAPFGRYLDSPARFSMSPNIMSPASGLPHPHDTELIEKVAPGDVVVGHGAADNAASLPSSKRRPVPLDLNRRAGAEPGHEQAPLTGMSAESAHSTLSNELLDLSALRRSVQQNLHDRPFSSMDEYTGDSDSDMESAGSGRASPGPLATPNDDRFIGASEALSLIRTSAQPLFIDTRTLDDFLAAHVHRSTNVSIPTLIVRRLRKHASSGEPADKWASLGSYVSTPAGRRVWDSIDLGLHTDIVIVGADESDRETPRLLASILTAIVPVVSARVLSGGWAALSGLAQHAGLIVSGESSESPRVQKTHTDPTFYNQAPAPSQMAVPPRHLVSSLAVSPVSPPRLSPARSLPSLSINPTRQQPPKLCLKIDKTIRTSPVPPILPTVATRRDNARPKPMQLTLDVGESNHHVLGGPRSAMLGGSVMSSIPHTPRAAYSDHGHDGSLRTSSLAPSGEPWSHNRLTVDTSLHNVPVSPGLRHLSASSSGARHGHEPEAIQVSTILPSFLYLGPEITTRQDVEALQALGVKRILNVAFECDDDEGLGLRQEFDRYLKIPMRDTVEESGVGKGIRDACDFLDDARLHSAPAYVHCKAGKSRSVTVVLAYLIHANAWTLKTSYAYVAERRPGISPNIGFVAELIQFEESELGSKQATGVHDSTASPVEVDENNPPLVHREPKPGPRYTRESMPPEYGPDLDDDGQEKADADLDLGAPEPTATTRLRRRSGADIEVRKNGQWVHHRRAPVDRTTLQPGRRVSKAGLESMAIRPIEHGDRPRPTRPGTMDT
ncbi:Dual specificity protein phosphatase 1-B [Vanrija pseudolonga]|uniref:protein-tyrosine-phosphatase n=1 Tax=Vanrija pseudolonga TaxID=143232 RepID=A0AAF0YI51_9TREE|nr:Dual specificity protein phosphatase 1-B [Vanrija pseudolonga]